MQLTKNFTLEELVESTSAKNLKIDNTPTDKDITYLKKLAFVLQQIRDEYGKPIVVNSAFRCPKLNKAVGGATNSDHKFGCAADIRCLANTKEGNRELFNLIVEMAKKQKIECRQIIDEYNYSWVHVAINNEYNSKKINQIVHIG